MDPITETVIWGVVWFFGAAVGAVIVYLIIAGMSVWLAALLDSEWIAVVGVITAWISAVIWEIFAIVQVILHGVTLFQLMT